jgi:aminoglycoside phosphotransferase (APT) family kinase protein
VYPVRTAPKWLLGQPELAIVDTIAIRRYKPWKNLRRPNCISRKMWTIVVDERDLENAKRYELGKGLRAMQPCAFEPVTSQRACRRVIERAVPEFPVQTIETLQPGWDSIVFLINDRWIFRFPARPIVAEALRREIHLLPIIACRTDVPVPRFGIIARHPGITPFLFVGYRALPGQPLHHRWDSIDDATKSHVAHQIGRFLRDLHSTPLQHGLDAGLNLYNPDAEVAERDHLISGTEDLITGELGRTAWGRISSQIRDLLRRIDWQAVSPVLIHGDLGSEHILIDREQGNRVSIIDFGDMEIGDPACDFAGLPDDIVLDALQAYGLDLGPDFPLRRKLYRTLIPFHALEAGKRLNRPDLVKEGLERLRTVHK